MKKDNKESSYQEESEEYEDEDYEDDEMSSYASTIIFYLRILKIVERYLNILKTIK